MRARAGGRASAAIVATVLGLHVAGGVAGAEPFGVPLRGLTADERARFELGRTLFDEAEEADEGLGPVFNGTSCGGCHSVGGIGGGSEVVETRFGATSQGVFDPLDAMGGSLIQTDGIGPWGDCNFVGETVPPQANTVAGRRTTPLFGLGLVDAVPDFWFHVIAAVQKRYFPATAGRVNLVPNVITGTTTVGKFGWKSQVPNLLQFSGDAYVNEMGITTPMFPDEPCPQGDCDLLACDPVPGIDDPELDDVEAFRDFMSMLAPPAPARQTTAARQGSQLFEQIGCANCHLPTLATGRSEVAALSQKVFHPYSDFLLHDMGSLGDGVPQGIATGREMRTAPLWGLRVLTTYLHDGRATTLEQAIAAHDGQGRASRDRFTALPADRKARIIAFLKTL